MSTHAAKAIIINLPWDFKCNPEALSTNAWMHKPDFNAVNYKQREEYERGIVLRQHYGAYQALFEARIPVDAIGERNPDTPDFVFPDGWLTFAGSDIKGGDPEKYYAVPCPMYVANRRAERKMMEPHLRRLGYEVLDIFEDMGGVEYYEQLNRPNALEGKGAVGIDPVNKIIYCALSERCYLEAAQILRNSLNGYQLVAFFTEKDIYHRDLMLSIGTNHALLCKDAILERNYGLPDVYNRKQVYDILMQSKNGKVFDLSLDEIDSNCGNVTEIENRDGELCMWMSKRAFDGFNPKTIQEMEKLGLRIVYAPIDMLEERGGGSANCMVLELRGIDQKNIDTIPMRMLPSGLWIPEMEILEPESRVAMPLPSHAATLRV